MRRVPVALGARSYDVLIGEGLLDRAGEHLTPFARDGRLVVVSDENVWASLGPRLEAALRAAGIRPVGLVLEPGEATKGWDGLRLLAGELLDLGIERGDTIVAFGGGMVGDLAGFAAAVFKRGCGFVQLPTSLLAQVDSSVGGKTAINHGRAKNMVGAFHQPRLVLIDPLTLDTLPECELRAGYAEVLKYGLIGAEAFFGWCEAKGPALLAGDREAQRYAIETCVRAKAEIVAADEREEDGSRALLNLGHSFGHAIEAETRLLHGEAVALGMALAFRFSAARCLCPPADAERVAAHLAAVGLPVTLGEAGLAGRGEALAGHISADKKARHGRPALILVRGIGRAFVQPDVDPQDIAAFLDAEP